jgi:hypothetical protein
MEVRATGETRMEVLAGDFIASLSITRAAAVEAMTSLRIREDTLN